MAEMKNYPITFWWGVPQKFIRHADGTLAVERFEEMREAGFNLIDVNDHGYETNCEVLAACERLGLRVTLHDHRINKAVTDAENREKLLAEVVRDYGAYPALHGYYVFDEPHSSEFAALADIRRILSELDPAHESYINLYPNYAGAAGLGNPTYYEHVDQFLHDVKPEILSYDHYSFHKDEEPMDVYFANERDRMIYQAAFRRNDRPGFFDNIEDVRTACLRAGTPFMVIVLLVEHGGYRNLTEAEIRWEVFQSLAYGSARLSYFTYWFPGSYENENEPDIWKCGNAMLNYDGTRNEHYDMVQRVNRELSAVGNILMGRTSEAVFHFGEEPDKKITLWQGMYGAITGMNANTMTAGFFAGNLVLLANKDYVNSTDVSFAVTEGKRVMHYGKARGIWEELTPANGCFSMTLAAGDGELIRIV
ncbi:MAG: hypothetical protein IJX80_09030 [Clostridia bacterium]|nr:hypothetical protein [Clostridia bacterium]